MIIQLSNTSTIFQLSFGINAIFALVVNHCLKQKKDLMIIFVNKIESHEGSSSVEGKKKYFAKYLFRLLVSHRFIYNFFCFRMILASASVFASYCFHLRAAEYPSEEIPRFNLFYLSAIMLLGNPIIYYSFFRTSEWFGLVTSPDIEYRGQAAIQGIVICFASGSINQ